MAAPSSSDGAALVSVAGGSAGTTSWTGVGGAVAEVAGTSWTGVGGAVAEAVVSNVVTADRAVVAEDFPMEFDEAAAPGVSQHGPLYGVIFANSRRACPASEAVRALLAQAEVDGSVYSGGDGTHFSPFGVEASAPSLRELLVQTGAHLIVSDSTLCCVDAGWPDKRGRVVNAAVGVVPVRPWWGASFLSTRSSFAQAISWAHEDCGGTARVVLLFIAGNDIDSRNDPRGLDLEMRRIRADWAERGVEVLYIDVVPPSFHSI